MESAMSESIPNMRAAMTPFPYCIEVEAGIAAAEAMMAEHGIRHLPVTDGEKLLGVVSDRDLERALSADADGQPDEDLSVGDALEEEAFIVDVTETLDNVLLAMFRRRLGSALVLDAGTLAGIFTCSDACRLFAEYLREDEDDGD
jgi:acetoin utilization protein AcuB